MQLTDYYDEDKWGDLTGNRVLLQREAKALSEIKKLPKQPKKVLDVGCGDGFFLKHVDELLHGKVELHGIDYSEYKIKQAKKLPFTFKRANIEEKGLPYKDKAFDLVYAAELIEHLFNPDFFLGECRRVLKPGAHLIISTPNLQAWYNRFLFLFGIQPLFYETSTKSPLIGAGALKRVKKGTVPVGHVRVFNYTAIRGIIMSQGFELVAARGANFAALPGPVLVIDNFITVYPRLASNMILVARRR